MLLLLVFCLSLVGSTIIDLTPENFDSVVRSNPNTFVLFFSPWCELCEKFIKEEFDKIVSALDNSQFTFGKVDVGDDHHLAELHSVTNFPSIKLYRQQTTGILYEGEHIAERILVWIKRKTGTPSQLLSNQAEIDAFLNQPEKKILAKVQEGGKSQRNWLRAAGAPELDKWNVGHIIVADEDSEGITAYKPGEEPILFDNEILKSKILRWLEEISFSLLEELTEENWAKAKEAEKPLLVFIVKTTDDKDLIELARQVALKFKSQIITTYTGLIEMAKNLGASGRMVPTAILIHFPTSVTLYNEDTEKEFSLESVSNFVSQALEGNYVSYIKSEPIPETNDEPVKIIVRKTYDEIVNDPNKNVFVKFYAPWCAYCQTLAPIWTELAESLKDQDDIIIAKFDLISNSSPPELSVEKYPTLIFFPKGDKQGIPYTGQRNVEKFKDFINTHIQTTEDAKPDL